MICLTTDDGAAIYPRFQFGADAQLLPGLPEIWTTLTRVYDDWDAALWLNTPVDECGGRTAAQRLRDDGVEGFREVLAEARENVSKLLT